MFSHAEWRNSIVVQQSEMEGKGNVTSGECGRCGPGKIKTEGGMFCRERERKERGNFWEGWGRKGGGRQRGNFWEEREPERLYGKEGKGKCSEWRGKARKAEISVWEGAGEGGEGKRHSGNFWEEREPERLYGKEGKGKCPEVERERLQGKEGKGKCSEVERERKERGNVLKGRGKGEMF